MDEGSIDPKSAMFYPAAPPDGGYLVLNSAQISNLDLLCLIKRNYPRTAIIPQKRIPTHG